MSIAREAARTQRRRAAEERREQKRDAQDRKRRQQEDKRVGKQRAKAEEAAYYAGRELEAIELSEDLLDEEQALRNILGDTLSVDDTIDFDALRVSAETPLLAIPVALASPAPQPVEAEFLGNVPHPEGLARLWPGAQRERSTALMEAAAAYAAALDTWHLHEARRVAEVRRLKTEHADAVAARAAKRRQRDAEIDAFREAYAAGDPDAIVAYNSMVLERSGYPEGVPKSVSLAYNEAACQLVVELELPTVDIVPREVEFVYVRGRDAILAEPRDEAEIAALYTDIVAAIALRTLHEIFEADQGGFVDTVCFNGFVHAVDPATGHDRQPHLISVRTTAEAFAPIDLARVDKLACLQRLGAVVSPDLVLAAPIAPIVDFDDADAHFVAPGDRASCASEAPNLVEFAPATFAELLARMFAAMGLAAIRELPAIEGRHAFAATDERPLLGGRLVIDAQRARDPVGVAAVRDLYGVMARERAPKGILITTSSFAPEAVEFAASRPIELIDGAGLLYLLGEIGHPARIAFPPE